MKQKSGFTLLEVIVTAGILSFLTGSITMVFLTTFRAFNAGQDRGYQTNQLAQAMQRIASDVENSDGIVNCDSTNLSFYTTGTGTSVYSTYYIYNSTNLMKRDVSAPYGSGQVISKNLLLSASTLCTFTSGGLTVNLTTSVNPSTRNAIVENLKTNVYPKYVNPLLKDLEAWWKFDENAGTVIYDSSGHNHWGTISGSSGTSGWTTGIANWAYTFTKANTDWVLLANAVDTSTFTSGTYTIAGWVYMNGSTTQGPILLAGATTVGAKISNEAAGYVPTLQLTGANSNAIIGLMKQRWYHLAFTWDSTNKYADFYINGEITSTTNISGGSGLATFDRIARSQSSATVLFNGKIDDLRVYRRILSHQEIKELYCQYGNCCAVGSLYCPGSSGCIDLSAGTSNYCGHCWTVCSGGTPSCSYGKCCAAGQTNCAQTCVDTTASNVYCGNCTTACSSSRTCVASVCTCPSPDGPYDADTFGGTITNAANAVLDDATYATHASSALGASTKTLTAQDFDFAIPTGVTIDGIVVEIDRKCSLLGTGARGSPGCQDVDIQLMKAGVAGGEDKQSATYWPTADAYQTYGTSSSLWGQAWTAEDINDTTFGVYANTKAEQGTLTASIDHIRTTVYYTCP